MHVREIVRGYPVWPYDPARSFRRPETEEAKPVPKRAPAADRPLPVDYLWKNSGELSS